MSACVESTALQYPHENLETLREGMHGFQQGAYELGNFARFLGLQLLHIETLDSRSRAFTIANGSVGADVFPSKQRFSQLINELGYCAPQSVTVEAEKMAQGVDYYNLVAAVDERRDVRFCKPANGACGRGAKVTETIAEALNYVAGQSEPFLIQSFEKPENDWRYILHRDSTQLATSGQAAWHVLFKVKRPVVVGDGSKSILQLVSEDSGMPEGAKHNYIDRHQEVLDIVPGEGEEVQLLQTGNRAQGAYRIPHTLTEERKLDRFMGQLLRDLEKKLDTRLGTFCVDIGVKDSSALQAPFDFYRLRDIIVFYEHQLPFGMKPYLQALPEDTRWSPTDALVPASRRRQYVEGQVYTSFIRSVIRSGKLLRSN